MILNLELLSSTKQLLNKLSLKKFILKRKISKYTLHLFYNIKRKVDFTLKLFYYC